jgi:cephalosporin-C deacetylase-like acetyl esterase
VGLVHYLVEELRLVVALAVVAVETLVELERPDLQILAVVGVVQAGTVAVQIQDRQVALELLSLPTLAHKEDLAEQLLP